MAARDAGLVRYRLAPGETAVVGLAAADREQARVLLGYASAPFEAAPALRGLVRPPSAWARLADLVTRRTRWGFDLTTGVSVEVRTASYGSIRGRTYALVVADELAFWQGEDGSNPASEVLTAVRPGLATLDGQLVAISTPYAKAGPLWEAFARFYGKDDAGVLVWRAPSRAMNPTIPERVVLDALERDEAAARAEWLAEFRDDVSGFVAVERLRTAVVPGRTALPRDLAVAYAAFFDGATGSGADSTTCAMAHVATDGTGRRRVVLDALLEIRPPFSPREAVGACAALCQAYGVRKVGGDRFAGAWPVEIFREHGITYTPDAPPKSELYRDFLVLLNSGGVELLDQPRLLQQLAGLERRAAPGGREHIDHAPGQHDDVANAAAGAVAAAVAPVLPGLQVYAVTGRPCHETDAGWRRVDSVADAFARGD